MSQDGISAYLQRLTGAPDFTPGAVRLTSAQKAAFAAWLRRENIRFSAVILQQPVFSVAALTGGESIVATAPALRRPVSAAAHGGRALLSRLRVGIDLEHTAALPDASDYREHEFYRDNFTPEEIAYCLQRADCKTSLCGLWAAKEAVVKASGSASPDGGLCVIEIHHDENGRPHCDGGELSISHSGNFCVAVFIALD